MKTPKSPTPVPIRMQTFEELCRQVATEEAVSFTIKATNQTVQVRVRALMADETAALDMLTTRVAAGLRKDASGVARFKSEADSEFVEAWAKATHQRKVMMVAKGLVEPKIPFAEEPVDQVVGKMEKLFPEGVIEFLFSQIDELSSGGIKVFNLANFTSNGGSPEAQS